MFYYLHLTRPPPEQAHPTQPLPITPNIANDLRTEFPAAIEGGIDIYYAWVKSAAVTESQNSDSSGPKASSGSSTVSRALGPMTHPLKLITWMGNSYKEVLVFPPKDVHEGQSWQILLCTKPAHLGKFTTSIDLASSSEAEDGAASFGAHVLPILSAPILFSSRRKLTAGKTLTDKKQVQNERILKFPPLWGTAVGPLRITEHLSYDLDKKIWDSGLGLSHWLTSNVTRGDDATALIVRSLMKSNAPTILELGAGTGLVSLVLSTLLSHLPRKLHARVVTTDLASAMEVLDGNIKGNAHWFPSVRPETVVLDWNDETLPSEVQDGVDFIIMADVTYNTDSFPALIDTLARIRQLRPDCAPAVLLAYKERHPDERRLWDMTRTIGLRLDEVARVSGACGNPVEIFVGTFHYED